MGEREGELCRSTSHLLHCKNHNALASKTGPCTDRNRNKKQRKISWAFTEQEGGLQLQLVWMLEYWLGKRRHRHFIRPELSKTCLFTTSLVLPVKYSAADRNLCFLSKYTLLTQWMHHGLARLVNTPAVIRFFITAYVYLCLQNKYILLFHFVVGFFFFFPINNVYFTIKQKFHFY